MTTTDSVSARWCPSSGLHPAIPLLLQHECVCTHQDVVCTLLRTSKSLQEAFGAYCRGRLAVRWFVPAQQSVQDSVNKNEYYMLPMDETTPFARYFSKWLAKHAVIASSLTLPRAWMQYSKSWQHAAAADVAAGLQAAALAAATAVSAPDAATAADIRTDEAKTGAAAAAPNALVLQACSAYSIDSCILTQLPANTLTSLSLSHFGELHGVAAVNAALLRLTNIKTLSLHHGSRPYDLLEGFEMEGFPVWALPSWQAQDDACWSVDALLPGLAAMSQLTR
jgi:hypothetical protein